MRYTKNLAIALAAVILVLSAAPSFAQQGYLYAMNSSAPQPFVFKIDLSNGNILQAWTNLSGVNGRGIAVIGNSMYYTTAESRIVRKYDLTTGSDVPSEFFTVNYSPPIPCEDPGVCGLATLAYDANSHYLYIGNYTSLASGAYGEATEVFVYDISNPKKPEYVKTILRSMAHGQADGLEYFVDNGQKRLISNRGDGQDPYDEYDTNGIFQKTLINSPDHLNTGITWDGTYFYTGSSDGSGTHLDVFTSSGTLYKKIQISGVPPGLYFAPEDLSIEYPDPLLASCLAGSSPTVLVNGSNVTAYIPHGNWRARVDKVFRVQVEPACGTAGCPTAIPTGPVNSCASNPVTLQTVCTGDDNTVYVIQGSTITNILHSGGTGEIYFSGGSCTNCGVIMDAVHNRAIIALSDNGQGAFQALDLNTLTFRDIFDSGAPSAPDFSGISEGILFDPVRDWILNPVELGDYQLGATQEIYPLDFAFFYDNIVAQSDLQLDSAAEDCTTGIALASDEFHVPVKVFIADLTQVTTSIDFDSWNAPSQAFVLTEADFPNTAYGGIMVAPGTHTAILASEFYDQALVALKLPDTSGTGTPAVQDWVACRIGSGFSSGTDPHTVTAYMNRDGSAHAIGLLTNGTETLARVDLTEMLDKNVVKRTMNGQGHACVKGDLSRTGVVTLIGPYDR